MSESLELRPTWRQRFAWSAVGFLVLAGVAWNITASPNWTVGRALGLAGLAAVSVITIATAVFTRLQLTPDGFRQWSLLGSGLMRWADINDLRAERGLYVRFVTFRIRPGGQDPRPALFRRISPRAGVPTRYGRSIGAQLELLEAWRRRFSEDQPRQLT